MMKLAVTTICVVLLACSQAWAQTPFNRVDPQTGRDAYGNQVDPSTLPDNLEDSTDTEVKSLPPKLYMWKLSETLGNQILVPIDTLHLNFQNSNLTSGLTGEYNYLGNMGSPRLSRIYFNRPVVDAEHFFLEPLNSFFYTPGEQRFTNSNIPYTNLTYYKAGNKVNGEDHFKSYFSLNVNKRLAFGFNIDYLYGRGYYQKQATSFFNGGLFGSYMGDRYQMQAVYNVFNMKMNENGGIENDRHITDADNPEFADLRLESTTMPVRYDAAEASNRNKNFYVYLTHRYRLGFDREKEEVNGQDTLVSQEFVPVTSFIHTLKVERSRHRFRATNEDEAYFPTQYALQKGISNDSTTALSVKNVVGIALLEGFNKYAKAGLTAYISHKFSNYYLMNTDTTTARKALKMDEQEIFVGGELAKRQGRTLHYNINGEVGVLDKAIGQFKVNGDLDLNFPLWRDTVTFKAHAAVSNTLPNFYLRHYRSNHYNWDNDLDKEFRTRVEGELEVKRWGTRLRAGMENIKNYTYLGQNAMPQQTADNIQVLSARLNQNFRVGIFHLDNEVTWQKSSNESVLPLPQLSLYHNFYILTSIAKKVLKVQLGAELVYFSKYAAPYYSPVVQQFHLQPEADRVDIGGYPFINAYVNLLLKRTRIFVMMQHINQGMGNSNAFTVPHYPVNPTQWLSLGVSWNFYD